MKVIAAYRFLESDEIRHTMKFVLDSIELEYIPGSKPITVKIRGNGYHGPDMTLPVNKDSVMRAKKAIAKGEKPGPIKFGSFMAGARFSFRKEEGLFYLGSFTCWNFPLFGTSPFYCFNKRDVIAFVEYFSELIGDH